MTVAPKILVADDEASLRQMMDVLLRRMGHEVTIIEQRRDRFAALEEEDLEWWSGGGFSETTCEDASCCAAW